ncbi:recombinase family protein [Roseomonas sp. HF4]|uniref:recombinase family protein n=1 Tax=Roseomonas sp. HF4 TaxID=2562313 RepID=UPI0010BF6855|nr:recombinase family protein [Roseomonas sp. HF4]
MITGRAASTSAAAGQRCALYARFSSENQRDASIEDQVRICRARAGREGWQVTAVYPDHALSGSTALRPGYQALMSAMRGGEIDVVLTESLDRLSRDQEHIAGFFKQAQFAGVRIVTLAEGEISELHVGLKGTMGALFLRDLADKTRRGLEGRVREGCSGGGLCYGYRVVRGPAGRDGEPERGLREIDPVQASVIQRIFRDFAGGVGPKSIAAALNREGVPGPRGGIWQAGTIRGQAARDTGILRNRLYAGQRVWNQRRWIKDPATGRRLARQNGADDVVVEEIPALRIIDPELWQRVQQRLDAQRAQVEPAETGVAPRRRFWEQKRPRHLLTGKVMCGHCGKAMASAGRDYLACRVATADGPCGNRSSVRRGALEAQVLEALGSELMRPELVAEFAAEFTRELNRLAAESSAGIDGKRRELDGVRRKLSGLIDAIADGLRAPGLQGKLDELEARRATLEAEIATAGRSAIPPRLHPNIAGVYRERVTRLREALAAEGGTEVLEEVRALVDRVEVHAPVEPGGAPRLELIGELTAMLRAAGVVLPARAGVVGGGREKGPRAVAVGPVAERSVKVDAGTGFEPVTFRL